MLNYYGVSVSHQKMTENLSVIINKCKILISFCRSVFVGQKYCSVCNLNILWELGRGEEEDILGVDDGCVKNDRHRLAYVRFGRCWQCVYASTVLVVSEIRGSERHIWYSGSTLQLAVLQ